MCFKELKNFVGLVAKKEVWTRLNIETIKFLSSKMYAHSEYEHMMGWGVHNA